MLEAIDKGMTALHYQKMAGTAAVFVVAGRDKASPVERDGLVWTREELHLDQLSSQRQIKPTMATVLALEGLEEYDQPNDGDIRQVAAINEHFVYHQPIRGWIQIVFDG